MRLEQRITRKLVVLTDKHGMNGETYCGHCRTRVPEPYYERKRCRNCRYSFSDILNVHDLFTDEHFEYNPLATGTGTSYFEIFGEVVKPN